MRELHAKTKLLDAELLRTLSNLKSDHPNAVREIQMATAAVSQFFRYGIPRNYNDYFRLSWVQTLIQSRIQSIHNQLDRDKIVNTILRARA